MPIKFETNNLVFTAEDMVKVENEFTKDNIKDEKSFKNYMYSKFEEFIHDEEVEQPLEKYQEFEDYIFDKFGHRKDEYGMKDVDVNKYKIFNDSKDNPTMNPFFKSHLGTLSPKDFNKVVTGFKKEATDPLQANSVLDDNNLKLEQIINARKELNPFLKFIYWLFGVNAPEKNTINEIKNDIQARAANKNYKLKDPATKEKSIEEVKRKELIINDLELEDEYKPYTPLTNEKFTIKKKLSHADQVINATVLKDAITEYKKRQKDSLGYSVDQVTQSYKELKDMAGTLGLDEIKLNEAIKQKEPLLGIIKNSKKNYTEEEITKYKGEEEPTLDI